MDHSIRISAASGARKTGSPQLCPAVAGAAGEASPDDVVLIGLLRATRQGDRAAFRKLYDLSSRRLYGVVLKILRDASAAQDVLQDVYLKVWERASTYQPDSGSPLGWMIAIARNRAIDEIRARARRASEGLADEPTESISEPNGMVDIESQDALAHCLGHLEDEHRSCIVLAYLHGYSREELATTFKRPVNTIKTWLHRSLGQLKLCLERT